MNITSFTLRKKHRTNSAWTELNTHYCHIKSTETIDIHVKQDLSILSTSEVRAPASHDQTVQLHMRVHACT